MIPLTLHGQKDKTMVTKKRGMVARSWEAGVTTHSTLEFGGDEAF